MTLPTEKLYTWQRGTDVPFRTRASMGKVVDARPVFVFGFNPDVQAVEETIKPTQCGDVVAAGAVS